MVRKNAVKHGMRMESFNPVVADVESADEWKAHLGGMIESLEPEGYHEEELAGRIAEILWRLRRVSIHERDKISIAIAEIPDDAVLAACIVRQEFDSVRELLSLEEFAVRVGTRLLPSSDVIAKVTRYEAHLHRIYIQTLHELEALQARRRGERVPLTRLDISGPPSG